MSIQLNLVLIWNVYFRFENKRISKLISVVYLNESHRVKLFWSYDPSSDLVFLFLSYDHSEIIYRSYYEWQFKVWDSINFLIKYVFPLYGRGSNFLQWRENWFWTWYWHIIIIVIHIYIALFLELTQSGVEKTNLPWRIAMLIA